VLDHEAKQEQYGDDAMEGMIEFCRAVFIDASRTRDEKCTAYGLRMGLS
jgi:hypothetical protein